MKFTRFVRHLFCTDWRVRRAFPQAALERIERAIAASEATHRGQLCVAIEGALSGLEVIAGQSARGRAVHAFSHLRVWDTEHNNGVLIYLLLADRDVEILADRGIDSRVEAAEWARICRRMEQHFSGGAFEEGVLAGIEAVTQHLKRHFPAAGPRADEVPNRPVIL